MITSGDPASSAGIVPIRPSRLWYWLAGGLLAGAVICIALGVAGLAAFGQQISAFQRVPVPGQAEVTFAQPGGYILYIEGEGQISGSGDGSGTSALYPSWSVDVRLQPVNGGAPVSMSTRPNDTTTYTGSGHQGQAAKYFTIKHPGRYILNASHATPGSITDVAVGRGLGPRILGGILLLLGGLLVLTPAGLATGLGTAYRRRRGRRGPLGPPPAMAPAGGQWPTMSTPGGYPAGPYPGGSPTAARTYLQGGSVSFFEAIRQALRNAFVYRGRASRSAYWWFALFQVTAAFAAGAILFIPPILGSSGGSVAGLIIVCIVFIYLGLAGHALLVRRLHDIDKSGWWVFISFVPFVGPIVLLIFTVLEGTPGPNRYQPTRVDGPPATPFVPSPQR
jgi:uncharacterized membrane protein YhaH (DUF805 family)